MLRLGPKILVSVIRFRSWALHPLVPALDIRLSQRLVTTSLGQTRGSAMTIHAFTRDYTDHSSNSGFQFEFRCDHCRIGYRSTFVANKLGIASELLHFAGSLFGGSISNASAGADYVKDAFRGKAWDDAFNSAMDECRPKFRMCSQCGSWVCLEVCWNEKRNLCGSCAPDLSKEAAIAQAQEAKNQIHEKAKQTDLVSGVDLQATRLAACPSCNARLEEGGKFCPNCGKAVRAQSKCAKCGAVSSSSAHFCPECGTPREKDAA
jgi:hypothetical protein